MQASRKSRSGSKKPRSQNPRQRQPSLRDVYIKACSEHGIKPNSGVAELLPDKPGAPFPSQVLDITSNYIGDRGVLPVLVVLEKATNVRAFVAPHNGFRNHAVEALCAALTEHESLEYIDLSDNYISAGAGTALVAFLRENHRVKDIVIENTKISVDQRVEIRDLALANRKMSPHPVKA